MKKLFTLTIALLTCFSLFAQDDREVDHFNQTLLAVSVNGTPIGESDIMTLLMNQTLNLNDEYVEAPTITFSVESDTYYVGESEPESSFDDVDIVAQLEAGRWVATIQIETDYDLQSYTVTAIKPETVQVTYMDGSVVLGTEVVKKGEPATKFTQYENRLLRTFDCWYLDANLSSPVDLNTYACDNNVTFYGKFTTTYAKSFNIEQYVLDNGVEVDVASVFTDNGYAVDNIGQLSGLDDTKDDRNYPNLGLTLSQADAAVKFFIQANSTAKIRFGNVGADFIICCNGSETPITNAYANTTVESNEVISITAQEEDYLVEIICASTEPLIIKQIMINEEIQNVTLPAEEELGELTISEFLELKNTEVPCTLKGVVSNIQNTTYGNFDLTDDTGTIYVYGLLTAEGESKQFASLGIEEGDTLTLKAVYSEYNGTPQVKNGIFVSVEKAPVVEEHTYTVAGTVIFEEEWNPTLEANDMIEQEDGTYKWEKTDITLEDVSKIEFKVYEDHGSDVAYPDSNYELEISEDGIYTVTITFNAETKVVEAIATKTDDIEPNAIDSVGAESTNGKAVKVLHNGQLLIQKNGRVFTVLGQTVK